MSSHEITNQRIDRIITSVKCNYCFRRANDGDGDENVCGYSRCIQCDDEIRIAKCKRKLLICENCPIR